VSTARRGTLILVVGPSGAGKDSIIAGAAERLRDDTRVIFARRVITRPAEAGGESHVAVSTAEFSATRAAGRLMLHWRAHGLDYGLPQELAAALEHGKSVVANVSRTVVTEARRRFPPVTVVAVSA
jgi:phosphonate metabolism protein PhnN/1,5-bisphosphokinase (PRPP-forming)